MSDTIISKNRRFFFVAVNTGFVSSGLPDSRFIEFYQSRSSPQLHSAIVGNVVVPSGFGSNTVSPTLTHDPVWADVAGAIRTRGSKPGIQLATAWDGYVGLRKFVASDRSEFIQHARSLVEHFGAARITSVLDAFELGSDIAVNQGFSHIQFHAAHGYLLNLLIDQRINSKATQVLDRISGLAQSLRDQNIETSIRISMRSGDQYFDADNPNRFHRDISQLPFDYIDLSSGFYNIDKRLIYPSRAEIVHMRRKDSMDIGNRYLGRNFIISGRALRYDWSDIPHNMHVGICRDLIANPLVLEEPGNGCRNHGKCHYHSRGADHLTCGRWRTV